MNGPKPGSREWNRLVTASKVPAILGISPWQSPYSLWMQMAGRLDATPETTTTRRGHYLEAGVLAWWLDQHPEVIYHVPQYYAPRPNLPWAAATLDALALTDDVSRLVVEVKTAAYRDGWGSPGTDEIPAHYLAQVQWQLAMVQAAPRAHVAVLFGQGFEFAEYVVERDPATESALVRICAAFYASLDSEDPPPLDDSVATWDAVRRLHPDIDGTDVEIPKTLATRYVRAQAAAKKAEARARHTKSLILDRMGTARTASWDGTTIARRQSSSRGGVSLVSAVKRARDE